MDLGKFKSSRLRLTLWILIPPLLSVGFGLSTYALQLRSEWQLKRTRGLAQVLPRLVETNNKARRMMQDFGAGEEQSITSEEGLISFLQESARETDFEVDSLNVERRSAQGLNFLSASVTGSGSLSAIQHFLADVSTSHRLLSESSLQISQKASALAQGEYRADVLFDLVLFDGPKGAN